MVKIPENPTISDQEVLHDQGPDAFTQHAQQDDGSAAASPSSEVNGDAFLAAADDCAVTDQQTVLRLPVLENDARGDGQDIEIVSVTQPASGRASIAADGSINFAPDQPGHQEINYVVSDANGATTEAKAHVFVNPEGGAIDRPVLDDINPAELSEVARSCVDGMALDVARLAGDQIVVDPPAPGQRIQVAAAPGQQIDIQDPSFVQAKFLNVDGGLLMKSRGDGRMIFLDGFVAGVGRRPIPSHCRWTAAAR